MRRSGDCRHCGQTCEWIEDGTFGPLLPLYPCAMAPASGDSPGGHCEPLTDGDRMIRRIGDRTAKKASQRARGFGGRGKQR